MVLSVLGGFTAGFVHVLSGPDHLSAITPLSVDNPKQASLSGLRWGLGHTFGVCLLGMIALFLRESFPAEWLSGSSEKLVGIVLIGIGLWSIKKALAKKIHIHHHHHDGQQHAHVHSHQSIKPVEIHTNTNHHHTHIAAFIGVLHGFAGTSHIFGIVPALAFSTRQESILYLVFFGIGTVIAMTLFSSVIGFFAIRFADRVADLHKKLLVVSGSVAVLVGFVWIII